ncbi:hypothetical protein MPH_04033 [Macrophomina phaseolina MS6]|uniref:Uncharacterized protein n=1 Tax=Macrophomina phaseolina (strain MS6) TaxID=1126212 RepID=K2S154_MACPH|nr:hypothetical protein MPH_04033 [Macrophomina phaseolina MS6]
MMARNIRITEPMLLPTATATERNVIPPRVARRINLTSATTRIRPPSTTPQLVRSQTGYLRLDAPLSVRMRSRLRRFTYKVMRLFGKKAAPSPEEAQCPCWQHPPDGWRFCKYDDHVAEGIKKIAAREAALTW